jgi:hypothetical protein
MEEAIDANAIARYSLGTSSEISVGYEICTPDARPIKTDAPRSAETDLAVAAITPQC